MDRVVEAGNLKAALKRVRQNKGSPGVDGMTVDELPQHLAENWETLRAQLLAGTYQPKLVREVEIPKSGGGVRKLGIPSVLDRFLQQSILQVLQPMFDPTFSEHSHGLRPERSAHQAVCEAQKYIQSGPSGSRTRLRAVDGGRDSLLIVREVAARLSVSTATVYALCARRELPHVRVLNAIRVAPADLCYRARLLREG